MFPNFVSIHVNILSGSNVKPEDSAFDDICAFLKSQFDTMRMEPGQIVEALGYLVPHDTGIFIQATTAAEFLQVNYQEQFSILQSKGNGKGLKILYSLYFTVDKTSFRHDLKEEEIKIVTSVMGAIIFAKEPLDNDMLIVLPGVKSKSMLQFIQNSLVLVINTGSILYFHHCSFENFLLFPFFKQELHILQAIQD